jgi:hypothetical protein
MTHLDSWIPKRNTQKWQSRGNDDQSTLFSNVLLSRMKTFKLSKACQFELVFADILGKLDASSSYTQRIASCI